VNDQNIKVKGGRELNLSQAGQLKAEKFDKKTFEASDLYRFSDLRSQYLAEANVDVARQYYAGGPGWYGPGWYWAPSFWSYTWLPGDGIFYSPFGWGYYSPWLVGYAPYYGYYGGFRHYPRYGRPYAIARPGGHFNAGRSFAVAPHVGVRSFGAMGGGFRGAGGFHRGFGGEGFHGGGVHGGGVHR
jgi:hypothetical protein